MTACVRPCEALAAPRRSRASAGSDTLWPAACRVLTRASHSVAWQHVLELFHLAIQDGCGPLRLECSIYLYPSVRAAALEPSGVALSQDGRRSHTWDVPQAPLAISGACCSTGYSCGGPKLSSASMAGSQLHWQQDVQAT